MPEQLWRNSGVDRVSEQATPDQRMPVMISSKIRTMRRSSAKARRPARKPGTGSAVAVAASSHVGAGYLSDKGLRRLELPHGGAGEARPSGCSFGDGVDYRAVP